MKNPPRFTRLLVPLIQAITGHRRALRVTARETKRFRLAHPFLTLSAAAVLTITPATPSTAQAATGPTTASEYIVVLRDGANPTTVSERHRTADKAVITHIYGAALNGFSADLTPAALAAVKADPAVLSVTVSRTLKLPESGRPAPCKSSQSCPQVVPRGIRRVQADVSSAKSGDGKGAVSANIAIIDTGVDATHPDLNVVGGTNCIPDGLRAGVDPDGHGTMVAGVAAAKDDGAGVVGTAPGARLWSVRVITANDEATDATMICGIDWAAATRKDANPSNDITVANMSIGDDVAGFDDDNNCGLTNGDPLHTAICRSSAAGVTFVVAAGNDSLDFSHYKLSSYHEVLTVTGITDGDGKPGGLTPDPCLGEPDDTAVFFSRYGTADADHTVAAPAVCVGSDFPGRQFGLDSGTSFAAPHVTGAVALCIASGACAGLQSQQIVHKIVGDALAYTQANPGYGFVGDPVHPVQGKYYGPLINVGLY